jgi:hypothetical protein
VIEKKPKKQKKLTKRGKKGEIMAGGSQNNPGVGAAASLCKISPDPSGQFDFTVTAADKPVKIKLCEDQHGAPAKTSSFNLLQVYNALTNPPTLVAGQPTSMTAMNASLTLPAGAYDIDIVLNQLSASSMGAYVYEDCSSLNQLIRIPTPLKISGYFSLKVE